MVLKDSVDIDRLIGVAINEVVDQKGSFYINEIREGVLELLPDLRAQVYAVPWAGEFILQGLHRKVYTWVKSLLVTGRFKIDNKPIVHPKYGCMPDGKGNHIWFLVSAATDDELAAWEASRERKIAKQMVGLQTIRELRSYCKAAKGRCPLDVIIYE